MPAKPSRSEQILKLAGASPGIATSEAAEILGMSKANLGVYLSKLRKQGLLKKTRGTLELAAPASDTTSTNGAGQPAADGRDDTAHLLAGLMHEALTRAERYRQEGVLTNIVAIGTEDGQAIVRGAMGGGAMLCAMLTHPASEELREKGFDLAAAQAQMVELLGEGQGRFAVFVNMTDLGGEGAPQLALMSSWHGGQMVFCAEARLDALSLTDKHAWQVIEDGRREEFFERGRELAQDGDGQAVALRELEPTDGQRGPEALAQVLSDPERAPILVWQLRTNADGFDELGLGTLAPELTEALAGRTTPPPTAAPELSAPMAALLEQACAKVEEERQNGDAMNFVEIGLADGTSMMNAMMGDGQMLPLMTGLAQAQMPEVIAAIGRGQGERAVFVNMLDLASGGVDQVLVSAWEGGEFVLARIAAIAEVPLTVGGQSWRAMDADELYRLGESSIAMGAPEDERDDEPLSAEPQLLFETAIDTLNERLDDLNPEHFAFALSLLDQDGQLNFPLAYHEPQELPEVTSMLTVLACQTVFGICAELLPRYAVMAWASAAGENGTRMAVVAGWGKDGETQLTSYLRHADGRQEPQNPPWAALFLDQMREAAESEGAEQLSEIPDAQARELAAERAREALEQAAMGPLCISRGRQRGRFFHLDDLTDDNYFGRLYRDVPMSLVETQAEELSFAFPRFGCWTINAAGQGLFVSAEAPDQVLPARGPLPMTMARVLAHIQMMLRMHAEAEAEKN